MNAPFNPGDRVRSKRVRNSRVFTVTDCVTDIDLTPWPALIRPQHSSGEWLVTFADMMRNGLTFAPMRASDVELA